MTAQQPSSSLSRLWNQLHPYGLWTLFALPAVAMTVAIFTADQPAAAIHEMIHPSGEMSARFMIVAMMATPLTMLLRDWRGPKWMKRNRRHLGVAAFGYALLHTILYLIDKAALDPVLSDLPKFYIWTGWVAFLIFVPLAITSHDWWVRTMGTWWKWLQRWTYAAAVLTLAHWAALNDWGGIAPALVHFGPLIALEAYRVWYWYLRPRPVAA